MLSSPLIGVDEPQLSIPKQPSSWGKLGEQHAGVVGQQVLVAAS